MKPSVAKHYGCKRARYCGLIANGRDQANRDFVCVRNMNCCFAHSFRQTNWGHWWNTSNKETEGKNSWSFLPGWKTLAGSENWTCEVITDSVPPPKTAWPPSQSYKCLLCVTQHVTLPCTCPSWGHTCPHDRGKSNGCTCRKIVRFSCDKSQDYIPVQDIIEEVWERDVSRSSKTDCVTKSTWHDRPPYPSGHAQTSTLDARDWFVTSSTVVSMETWFNLRGREDHFVARDYPFTPKSEQFQISPAASPILHNTVAFHSLLRWKMIILKTLGECTFELGSERVKVEPKLISS